ncbi:sigma-70 family RNA polymerase sigma factor [Niallia sp. HCP3S3_B10]|uniref:sigma-70 family RNA polymerase sigma factor n=1 Tax=Niallia sp. HCP3S3_B10 TaxID=3438944 RepID=UPI003F8A8509
MKKTILFSKKPAITMTFEEVRNRFLPMLVKTMKIANQRFIFNAIEEDDFQQILEIELWRAYEQYSSENGTCFSTYLFYKLQKGVRNATYHKYSLKNQGIIVSMNTSINKEDFKLEDILADNDASMNNLETNELSYLIIQNTSDHEKELLSILLDKQTFTVNSYAKKHGITRQAANQRVIKFKKKLQKIIANEYLGIS